MIREEAVAREAAEFDSFFWPRDISGQLNFEQHRDVFMRIATQAIGDWKQPRWMLADGLALAACNSMVNHLEDDPVVEVIRDGNDKYWWELADCLQRFIEVNYPT